MKKRGFGVGKWNGSGGKLKPDENPKSTTIRELREEFCLQANEDDLSQVALIDFYFENEYVFECHIFFLRKWTGDHKETEEMKPEWFPISNLPFHKMWVDDEKWLPLVLSGKKIKAKVIFNREGTGIKSFEYEEVEFR